jgi:hypothetical protein
MYAYKKLWRGMYACRKKPWRNLNAIVQDASSAPSGIRLENAAPLEELARPSSAVVDTVCADYDVVRFRTLHCSSGWRLLLGALVSGITCFSLVHSRYKL